MFCLVRNIYILQAKHFEVESLDEGPGLNAYRSFFKINLNRFIIQDHNVKF